MSQIWKSLPRGQYLSLAPWAWVQLESADPPGPFPFIGGVAPEVVASLHEAHGLLSSAIDTAISDVFSKRAPLDDPDRQRRLEDAYAEVISARPYLQQHIRCGRKLDGTFQWEFPTDPTKSATVTNGGLRIFHSVKRQAIPIGSTSDSRGRWWERYWGSWTARIRPTKSTRWWRPRARWRTRAHATDRIPPPT